MLLLVSDFIRVLVSLVNLIMILVVVIIRIEIKCFTDENFSIQVGWITNRVIEVLTKNCVNLYQSPNFLVPTLALYFSG